MVYATVTDYEPTGKMGQIDYGNGVVSLFEYYPQNTRLETIWTEDDSQNLLQNRTYHYLPSGDIQQIVDGLTLANYTYTYDPLHRLTSETATDAVQTFTDHVLDFDHSAAGPVHAPDGVTANGEVFSYAYDANGNMISGWDFSDPLNPVTRTIDYNADNMPETITHSANGTTTFAYDGENQRVKKTAGGSDTYYVNKYFEVEGTSSVKYVFAGNQRIAWIAAAGTRYFHQDHLGSATVVTYATGAQAEGSEYLPFGGQRSHVGTVQAPYKFTDQELDTSTGLYNYDARLYDSGVGRFVSADSIVPRPFDPQSLNRYSYVYNTPLRYTDPTGHMGDSAALAAAEAGRDMANSDSPEGRTLSQESSGSNSGYVLDTITVTADRIDNVIGNDIVSRDTMKFFKTLYDVSSVVVTKVNPPVEAVKRVLLNPKKMSLHIKQYRMDRRTTFEGKMKDALNINQNRKVDECKEVFKSNPPEMDECIEDAYNDLIENMDATIW